MAREIARLTHTGVPPPPWLRFWRKRAAADAGWLSLVPCGGPSSPTRTWPLRPGPGRTRQTWRAGGDQREVRGYIQRQQKQVEDFRKMERRRLPPDLDYSSIQGLRLEAREKLNAVRPADLGRPPDLRRQPCRRDGADDLSGAVVRRCPAPLPGPGPAGASGKGRGTPLETQARHLVEQAEADVLRRGGQHLLQHMVLEERLLAQRASAYSS
ncbi:MAG: hypothetical protein ACLTYN_13980 [Dysosmobacter welbionis]